jgi:hypothetical protein
MPNVRNVAVCTLIDKEKIHDGVLGLTQALYMCRLRAGNAQRDVPGEQRGQRLPRRRVCHQQCPGSRHGGAVGDV